MNQPFPTENDTAVRTIIAARDLPDNRTVYLYRLQSIHIREGAYWICIVTDDQTYRRFRVQARPHPSSDVNELMNIGQTLEALL